MICIRLLNYRVPLSRHYTAITGRSSSYSFNYSKALYSFSHKRNLYQTVKKRALEAQIKLKKTDYTDIPRSPNCPETPEPPTPSPSPTCKKKEFPKKPKCDPKFLGVQKPPSIPPSGEGSSNDSSFLKWLLLALGLVGLGAGTYFLVASGKQDCDSVDDDKRKTSKRKVGARGPSKVPLSSAEIPKKVPYLLIGGGAASFSAFRAIKSNDPRAKVLVVSNEYIKPYMRPPLSKELWYTTQPGEVAKDYRFKQWTGAERSLFFEPDEFFIDPAQLMNSTNGGIAVAHGYTVKKIDAKERIAILDDGTKIEYEKCLLATGCTPKVLPVFENAPKNIQDKIMYYRSPNDFEKLKHLVDQGKSVTVLGNGFLGSELCCSLATYSKKAPVKINQIYAEYGNMSRVLPEYLSKWTTRKIEEMGVCVVPEVQLTEVLREKSGLKLALSNGQTILTDVVVVCVGCEANTDIAILSGLEVDNSLGGFVVNAELEARQDLFVAGDASCFFDPLLGRRRLEHHDHSVISGRLAGENMVAKNGIKKPYDHQSMFWSDLGPEIGYEGIGKTEAHLPTVGVFALQSDEIRTESHLEGTAGKNAETSYAFTKKNIQNPKVGESDTDYQKGVIFYLENEKIVGILLWNIFNRVGLARTIINENKSYDDLNEVAKLFEIHS